MGFRECRFCHTGKIAVRKTGADLFRGLFETCNDLVLRIFDDFIYICMI